MMQKIRSDEEQISRLRAYNLVAGTLHLLQGLAFLFLLSRLSSQVMFPVTVDYMTGPPGVDLPTERVVLFEINLGLGVVAFLLLSAFFHYLISLPGVFPRYARGLKQQHNYFRWTEYSLSSSVMIWLIAQLTGVSDFAALVAIFAVNASMIMFGALQEKYETPGNKKFLPFVFGSITGVVPWIIIVIYTLQPGSTNSTEVPGFVIGIIVSLFVFFNTFAVNQVLQYRQVGGWRNYLRGERMYITLSLVAKSVLAWQVFSGALVPLFVD
ncbi:heliorhodopsin HeR [Leucobacter sp. W1153]|uniref:heliorhodopsin HeR n=1 Tax=Leucobacter sp. W1153 TaxID=3439064 RepID=UPI003F319855